MSHPSGRPIRRPKYGPKSKWRVPDHGYTCPRLRMLYPEADRLATAGGFGFQIAREGHVEDGMWARGERK